MSRLVTVRCPICGKIKKTRGNYFFKCCGIGMPINEHKVTENVSLKNLKNEQKNGKNEVKEISNPYTESTYQIKNGKVVGVRNGKKIRIILKENGDNYEK